FTTGEIVARLAPALAPRTPLTQIVICEGESGTYTTLQDFETAHDGSQAVECETDTPAAILYTSGTTGRQKGATLSHGNVLSNVHAVRECLRIDPSDRLLLFLPMFHCFGQNFIMNSGFASGATLVMHRRYEPQRVLDSI